MSTMASPRVRVRDSIFFRISTVVGTQPAGRGESNTYSRTSLQYGLPEFLVPADPPKPGQRLPLPQRCAMGKVRAIGRSLGDQRCVPSFRTEAHIHVVQPPAVRDRRQFPHAGRGNALQER